MISWENGGIAPIYLCESHANQVGPLGENRKSVLSITPQSVPSKHPTEQPKTSAPSGRTVDTQVGMEMEYLVARVPASDLTSGDSAKVLADEAIGNMPREDFEAYATVLQRAKPSTATEDAQAENSDPGHLCSRYAERCTYEATVHCPKCGRWFCDAHAEDGEWHPCALSI
jgi:hypothetical protein